MAPGNRLLVIAAVSYAAAYLRRHHGGRLALDIQHDLRTDIFDALSELDGKGQDELETGRPQVPSTRSSETTTNGPVSRPARRGHRAA